MDLSEYRYLVTTHWLAENLNNPDLRIIEATSLLPNYFEDDADQGLTKASGSREWRASHIPGSAFADILGDLSDQDDERRMYAMPDATRFAEVMSRLGVGNDSAVVIYDRQFNMWASRLWWMLRSFGFDNAAVVDGGWQKWIEEGRPVSSEPPNYPPATFDAQAREELIAQQAEVQEAIGQASTRLINALHPDEFAGRPPHRYARAGRIPSSVNVPFLVTVDPESQQCASDEELIKLFDSVGALNKEKVIGYCGGGIAACNTALALTRLGVDNVSLYDGSMTEWASDPSLPMETG